MSGYVNSDQRLCDLSLFEVFLFSFFLFSRGCIGFIFQFLIEIHVVLCFFQIVSTHVEEDSYELSLTVNFTMKGAKDPFAGKKMDMSKGDFLSNYTEGRGMRRYGSASSLGKGNHMTLIMFCILCKFAHLGRQLL